MSKQTITTLVLGVVLLLLTSVIGWQYYTKSQSQVANQSDKYLFAELDASSITNLTITTSSATTIFIKDNGQWIISTAENSLVADSAKISAVLENLSHMQIQSTVAANPSDLAGYQLDNAQVIQVTAQAGDRVVANINLGKAGAATQTVLAQREADTTVYLVTGQRSVFAQTDWVTPTETVTNVNVNL